MKKYSILLFIFLLLFVAPYPVFSQESTMHPYIGASINGFGYWSEYNGNLEIGFGVEGGLKYDYFYFGVELGLYGIVIYDPLITVLRLEGYIPPDELQTTEQYYGFHAGVVINKWLWLGAVILGSTATINHFTHDSTSSSLQSSRLNRSWFNVGPDIHLNFGTHTLIDLAYTIRRGLKLGGSYIF